MSKKNRGGKVIPFPPAPKPPVETAEDKAKAALIGEMKLRAEKCIAEVQASLAKHKCRVAAHAIVTFDGRPNQLVWDVEAIP